MNDDNAAVVIIHKQYGINLELNPIGSKGSNQKQEKVFKLFLPRPEIKPRS